MVFFFSATPSMTVGVNWKADGEPGQITQHQRWTSLMLFCLNLGSKSLQRGFKNLVESLKPEEWRL